MLRRLSIKLKDAVSRKAAIFYGTGSILIDLNEFSAAKAFSQACEFGMMTRGERKHR